MFIGTPATLVREGLTTLYAEITCLLKCLLRKQWGWVCLALIYLSQIKKSKQQQQKTDNPTSVTGILVIIHLFLFLLVHEIQSLGTTNLCVQVWRTPHSLEQKRGSGNQRCFLLHCVPDDTRKASSKGSEPANSLSGPRSSYWPHASHEGLTGDQENPLKGSVVKHTWGTLHGPCVSSDA